MGNIRQAGRQRELHAREQEGKESSSTAKERAMNELYEELETSEGERNVSRIAKDKAFAKNNQIHDDNV